MIPPGRTAGETFGVLPCPVPGEVTDGQLGHDYNAHRCAGLGFYEPQLAADALQRPANVKLPRVQVDVMAGHLAGVAVIGYADKPGKIEALTDAQAAAVITDLAEISTALRDTPCTALPN